MQRLASWLAALLLLTGRLVAEAQAPAATLHTVFTTECGQYFNWQTLGLMYSHRKSGQPGPITRLLSCNPEDLANYQDLKGVTTHIAPSWTHHPRTGDTYSGINKPVAVLDWLQKVDVKEDYVLIIDADMIMRAPVIPADLGAEPGWAVSAYFSYMKGVNNALALKHVPQVIPRNDTIAGPRGRRGDQVGGYTLMHTADLRRVAPKWVSFSEDVRADPDAWNLTGDAFTPNPGDKPWISEMYGYSFGCSSQDVWHRTDESAMLYPGYMPYGTDPMPKVLHYGLEWEVEGTSWKFDKHWYQHFDALVCSPWDLTPDKPQQGLFPHPPHPSVFSHKGLAMLRDLLAVEVVATVNVALCEYHQKHCPATEQMTAECTKAINISDAVQASLAQIMADPDLVNPCEDADERCRMWAGSGECEANPGFMKHSCRISCNTCIGSRKTLQPPPAQDTVSRQAGDSQQSRLRGKPLNLPQPPPVALQQGSSSTGGSARSAGDARQDSRAEGAGQDSLHTAASKTAEALKGDAVGASVLVEAQQAQQQAQIKPGQHGAKGGMAKLPLLKETLQDKAGQGQGSLTPGRRRELQASCTKNPSLTMQQVAQCLEAAARGEEFQAPPSQASVGSRRTTQAAVEQDPLVDTSDGVHHLQQMLRQDSADQMGGSKVGQKGGGMLRGRLIRPPSEVESAAVRFLRSGGDLGILLVIALIVLWRMHVRRSKPAPATKRSRDD